MMTADKGLFLRLPGGLAVLAVICVLVGAGQTAEAADQIGDRPLEYHRETFLLSYFAPEITTEGAEFNLSDEHTHRQRHAMHLSGHGSFGARRHMLFHNASDIGYHLHVKSGGARITIILSQADNDAFERAQEHQPGNEWKMITVPLEAERFTMRPHPYWGGGRFDPDRLVHIVFRIELTEPESEVYLEPFLVLNGQEEPLFDAIASRSWFEYADFAPAFEPRKYERRFIMASSMPGVLQNDTRYLSLLQEMIPNLALTIRPGYLNRSTRDTLAELAETGLSFTMETTPYLLAYDKINRDRGWEISYRGDVGYGIGVPILHGQHGAAWPHSATRQATREALRAAAAVGCHSYLVYDYKWQWRGRWGWHPATIQAFRDSLNERPGTELRLRFGDEVREWKFWDYFRDHLGFTWEPADLGYVSWEAFIPISDREAADGGQHERRRHQLFTALYHYELLRFTQQMGDDAAEVGLRLEVVPNPEDISNGADYRLFMRLDSVDGLFQQSFYTPIPFLTTHHSNRYFRRFADDAATEFNSSIEVSYGGHGKSYFDPEVFYVMSFISTSASYKDNMRHVYWANRGLEIDVENSRDRDNYLSFTLTAAAFNFAGEIDSHRPPARVASIARRSILEHEAPMAHSMAQRWALNHALASLGVDFDLNGFEEVDSWIDEYEVVFLGAAEITRPLWERLMHWVEAGGTLVTHSFVPASFADGEYHFQPGTDRVAWASRFEFHRPHLLMPELQRENELVRRDPDRQRWTLEGGKPIDDDGVVTEKPLGNGRIIHIAYPAGEWETLDRDREVVAAICDHVGIDRPVKAEQPVYFLRYQTNAGEAIVLMDFLHTHINSWDSEERGRRDREYRPHPYREPEIDLAVRYRISPRGGAILFDLIEGTERRVLADQLGDITLSLQGRSVALYFLVPPHDELALDKLRQQHAVIRDLLDPAKAVLPE